MRSSWKQVAERTRMRNSRLDSGCGSLRKSARRGSTVSRILFVLLGLAGLLAAAASNIDAVKAEPNLERRSALALDQAEARIDDARKAYEGGNLDQYKAQL